MRRTLLALVLCASLVTTGCASCGGYYYDDEGRCHQRCDANDFVVGVLTGFVLVLVSAGLILAAVDDDGHHHHHGHYCD
jgi:hypothetical protein